ncbi:MAG: patatin-like phospholipase family protein [Actinobacteria bacterium]|nr:patatin-like phospholipase family protein [Actinomycetota bacterium]MCG2802143.1 patatin-like phospholipase family protein [Cellulomonas sp.]
MAGSTAAADVQGATLGLVLSSGAARGAAHAGALLALQERGIDPHIVVGTSAGALVGGLFAAGMSPERVAERLSALTWSDFGRPRPSLTLALIETTALRTNLDWMLGHKDIADLPRRFGAVATDLRTRRAVLLDSGDAATAVQASIAVPGVFPAVHAGGRTLVDGVLTSPLPVWAAHRLGATRTIAVRLRPQGPPGARATVQRMVLPPAETIEPDVDIVIDTGGYSSWSARDSDRLVALGYETTIAALREVDVDALLAGGPQTCGCPTDHGATRAAS